MQSKDTFVIVVQRKKRRLLTRCQWITHEVTVEEANAAMIKRS